MFVFSLRRARLTCLGALALIGTTLTAQSPAPAADPMIRDLRWRNVGNANLLGRISSIDALESDWTHVIVGSASGGVWKSVNGGTSWTTIFDNYGAASIGDVKINQKNPNVIWVGTGEECGRNSAAWGDGVYKSTDGGKTFNNVGLKETYNIGKIILHPTNENIVYVAAIGNIYAKIGERGLFKTIDGGKSWTKLTEGLPNDPGTGAIDMVIDPVNPDVLYVTFWQRIRYPWALNSGGPHSGVFKTTNGGKSWTKVMKGMPASGDFGKIGIAISKTNPRVLMAHVEHGFQPPANLPDPNNPAGRGGGGGGGGGRGGGAPTNPEYLDMTKLGAGMYRSEDGGASWTFLDRVINRPFYYMHVSISPLDDKYIFSYNINYRRSKDGGKTWNDPALQGGGGEGGHCWHAMWHDPHNKNRYWIGSDGGLNLTHDDGATSLRFNNINVTQYYDVAADMREPYYVCGGLQDAGSSCGPAATRAQAIYTSDWYNLSGGDGYHAEIDPEDWRNVYTESQPDVNGGNVGRSNIETRERTNIRPNKNNISNYSQYITPEMEELAFKNNWGRQPQQMGPLRFNWSTPLLLSPNNNKMLYIGSNHLIVSGDRGATWRLLSGDLTKNDPEKTIRKSGGLTPDENPGGGAEYHGTIITISESSVEPGNIWVGTDDGNIQVTRDMGGTWTKVGTDKMPGLPNGRNDIWVSRVEASHHVRGTAYATIDGHRFGLYSPWIFKTTDYGKTWTSIANNLPQGHPLYTVKEDLKNPNLLFTGSEFAVFYSLNGGTSWTKLNNNMPTVAVHDVIIHPRDGDLIAATHGRGIWVMDDISALQQMTPAVQQSEATLFQSRPAIQWLSIQPQHNGGALAFRGENPTRNAIINYYLSDKVTGPVTFEITDIANSGTCTGSFDARAGINRIEWAMRWNSPQPQGAPGGAAGAGAAGGGGGGFGGGGGGRGGGGGAPAACLVASNQPAPAGGRGAGGGGGGGRGGGGGAGRVSPGTYKITMTANGKAYTKTILVRADPMAAGGAMPPGTTLAMDAEAGNANSEIGRRGGGR